MPDFFSKLLDLTGPKALGLLIACVLINRANAYAYISLSDIHPSASAVNDVIAIISSALGAMWCVETIVRWVRDRAKAGRHTLILIPHPLVSFWAPGPPNDPGIIQVRVRLTATNNTQRSVIPAHVELARLFRPFDYQEAHQIQIDDALTALAMPYPIPVFPLGTSAVNVIHIHRGKHAATRKPMWFRLRLTDQLKRRYRLTIKLMPHYAPATAIGATGAASSAGTA
jgi:hypothetical protein